MLTAVYVLLARGSFNNYVDKKRDEGVSRKSTLGHVTKGK
jgi:hypothetical protein